MRQEWLSCRCEGNYIIVTHLKDMNTSSLRYSFEMKLVAHKAHFSNIGAIPRPKHWETTINGKFHSLAHRLMLCSAMYAL